MRLWFVCWFRLGLCFAICWLCLFVVADLLWMFTGAVWFVDCVLDLCINSVVYVI